MKTIIVQGGGFMTSFTTGVLDAFQMSSYRPFESHIGISGGSIALSYFLSNNCNHIFLSMTFIIATTTATLEKLSLNTNRDSNQCMQKNAS